MPAPINLKGVLPLKLSMRRQGNSSKEVLSAVTTKEPIVSEERWRENSQVGEESGGPQQNWGPQAHEIIYERKGQF